jgi:isoleucyl-tRNA synthetase
MAYRTVLDTLFHALVRYAAPVLVFTAEEVWGTRFPDGESVHLLEWPELPTGEATPEFRSKWADVRSARALVMSAIEPLRREKVIGSGLQTDVQLSIRDQQAFDACSTADMAEICLTASCDVLLGDDDAKVTPTAHHKCGRCWRHLPDVTEDGALCSRCDHVVAAMDAAQ